MLSSLARPLGLALVVGALCARATSAFCAEAGAAHDRREGAVVMPLRSDVIKRSALDALNQLLPVTLAELAPVDIVTKADIDAQLDLEHIKDAVACDDTRCAAQIAGALGARYLVTGTVSKLGANIIVVLSLIDTKVQRTFRGQAKGTGDETLFDQLIDRAVRDVLKKAGIDTVSPTAAGDGQKTGAPAMPATNPSAASRCEITLAPDGCPSDATKPPVFDDDWEHAGTDDVRCLRRAMEYLDWCASSGPVVARYYEGAKVRREEKAERKTRCEIRFAEERCPAYPADLRTRWNDDGENASSDEARCMRRALEYFDACGSSSPVVARFYEGAKLKREEKAERKTRCELRFTEEHCPSLVTDVRVRWNDDGEHASSDEARCMRRAREYFDFCDSTAPVVARYYEGTKVKREEKFERKTRCELRFTEERCPSSPAETRMRWNDDWENASSDDVRCMRRAMDFFDACGSSAAVVARYYEGTTLKREERAERKTRCEIRFTEERCPALPADFRMRWNDDYQSASSDANRCRQRAAEWKSYCKAQRPVTARFYSGSSLVEETVAR